MLGHCGNVSDHRLNGIRLLVRADVRQGGTVKGSDMTTVADYLNSIAKSLDRIERNAGADDTPVRAAAGDAYTELCEVAKLLGVSIETPTSENVIRQAFANFASHRRESCKNTFGGGYKTPEEREIFHHGIDTVFNVIEAHAKGERQDF